MINKKILQDFLLNELTMIGEIAGYIWENRWAERNAGNFSINISETVNGSFVSNFDGKLISDDYNLNYLKGQILLVSGAGTRMRNISHDPLDNVCLVCVGDDGRNIYQFYPDPKFVELLPTSELATHLAVHETILRQGLQEKALLHVHMTEMIALSHIIEFTDEQNLTNLIWKMHPEAMLFLPEGIGLVNYLLPGSRKLADASATSFINHKIVVWEKHGCLSIGKNIEEAFDLLDVVAKAAKVFFLCKSSGFEPDGVSSEQLNEISTIYLKN
jgi:rhamnulose-1-phosphate aldolase